MKKIHYLTIGAFLGISLMVLFGFNRISQQKEKNGMVMIQKRIRTTDPPCLQMYYFIKQYADSFHIPINYAYGIAYNETGYRGPFDWKYNHKKTSRAGAVGPMQVMPRTASMVHGVKVKASKLKNNIEYNVFTSMKLLRMLHDRYNDWRTVFGYYNTGRPIVNRYALRVLHYQPSWIAQDSCESLALE